MNGMDGKTPYFSIITPVYNREQCITTAAQSVVDQEFENWELLLVDDGSTDNTPAIIDQMSNYDRRIKAIHLPYNQGVSAARNRGLQEARGEFLLFLDSDDAFLKGAFERLYQLINCSNHTDIDTVIFPIARFKPSIVQEERKKKQYMLHRDEIRKRLLAGLIGASSHEANHIFRPVLTNKCVKRKLFEDANIQFDINKLTWEDDEVCIKVIDKCEKIIVTEDALMTDRAVEVNNHLSMRYYSGGVGDTLLQYKWELNTFGDEFDFNTAYSLEWHFSRLQTWIWRTMSKDKNRKKIIGEVLRDPQFIKLVVTRQPKGIFEKTVRFFLKKNLYDIAYMVYSLQNRINRGECY